MRLKDGSGRGILLAALLLLAGSPAWGQQRPEADPLRKAFAQISPSLQRTLTRRMLKASYEELKKDVKRLVELATQLEKEVNEANEDVLSMEVVKKAEQIEKLAEEIQDRMKNL